MDRLRTDTPSAPPADFFSSSRSDGSAQSRTLKPPVNSVNSRSKDYALPNRALHEFSPDDCSSNLQQSERSLLEFQTLLADTQMELAESRLAESAARHKALHDCATGLPNRELFNDRLGHAIAVAGRHNWDLALLFIDLDGFKKINDTHGHAVGDIVLQAVAERLTKCCRDEDTVCRNGGDEFLLLLINPNGRDNIERIVHSIQDCISQVILAEGHKLNVRASIGGSLFREHGSSAEILIRHADAAMYEAKRRKSGFRFFHDTQTDQPG